jgi:hypothetical protein
MVVMKNRRVQLIATNEDGSAHRLGRLGRIKLLLGGILFAALAVGILLAVVLLGSIIASVLVIILIALFVVVLFKTVLRQMRQ